MPAVTIVAAWINADTGVGPAMASGSQVYRGICALLPVAPTNNNKLIPVMSPEERVSRLANTSLKVVVPYLDINQKTASKKPRSPMRFITKAFFAAFV